METTRFEAEKFSIAAKRSPIPALRDFSFPPQNKSTNNYSNSGTFVKGDNLKILISPASR